MVAQVAISLIVLFEVDRLIGGYLPELPQEPPRNDAAGPIETLSVDCQPVGPITLDDDEAPFRPAQVHGLHRANVLQLTVRQDLQHADIVRRLEAGGDGELRAGRS